VGWWWQGKKEPEKTSLYPLLRPTETLHCFSVDLWVHFDLLCPAQACAYMSPGLLSASLPVLAAGPRMPHVPFCPFAHAIPSVWSALLSNAHGVHSHPSLRYLLKCYLFKEAFSDTPI